jgi:phosphonate transport system substrate-binding protein
MSKLMALFLLLIVLAFSGSARAVEPLKLGVHPYLSASDLVARFTPLAEHLEEKIGRPVEVVISKDYAYHIDLIGKDELDIAYMGPASYVKLVEKYGRKPMLARLEVGGLPMFQGVIISRKDCACKGLSDLEGKSFAFGDPDSTMSHLVPRYMLIEAGIGIEKLAGYEFLKSHRNVALGVLMGEFHAGAVKEEVYYEYEERGLKVLAWTPEISEHVFVASNKLSARTVESLRKAMLGLGDEPEGKAVMSFIKQDVTAFVPGSYSDYENLRKILSTLEAHGVAP